MFQYFLKVVATQFRTLNGDTVNSHQYSVTHFERDLKTGPQETTSEGINVQHNVHGVPGMPLILMHMHPPARSHHTLQARFSSSRFRLSLSRTTRRDNRSRTSLPRESARAPFYSA